jgi:hypothetical protein
LATKNKAPAPEKPKRKIGPKYKKENAENVSPAAHAKDVQVRFNNFIFYYL